MRGKWAPACRLWKLLKCCPDGRAPLPPAPRPVAICRAGTLGRAGWHPNRHCESSPPGGTSSLPHPPGPPLALWFSHFRRKAALLFPRALMPGCPCMGGGLGLFINKAFAARHWQHHRRAQQASVSKLEFGLGLPM